MADLDINTPTPDDGREVIRLAVVDAVQELGFNTEDVGMSLSLADTLFSLLDAISARVDAIEHP